MGRFTDRLRYLKERAKSMRLRLLRRVWAREGSTADTGASPGGGDGFLDRLRARWMAWRRGTETAPERWALWPAGGGFAHPGNAAPADVPSWRSAHPGLSRVLRLAVIALAIFLLAPYLLVLVYRFVDPPFSALMVRRALGGTPISYHWRDLGEIAPSLPRTAVISEDAALCRHWGVDWDAVEQAIEDAEDGDIPRGASTIPMQVAKNLFLWPSQSYVRKALEIPIAYFINLTWPKHRIVEVYLNIAEWGRGIFGAEAAARHHFRKSAADLTAHESALLAASLPNPFVRHPGRPGPRLSALSEHLQARVAREREDASCVFSNDGK